MTETTNREESLRCWVSDALQHSVTLKAHTDDAGFRRYFSINDAPQWLAVDAPPATENTAQFLQVAKLLRRAGVAVPTVCAADPERGFVLVQNFGERLFAHELSGDNALALYGEALFTLLAIAQAPRAGAPLPSFDAAFIHRELNLFTEWFVGPLLGLTLTGAETEMLNAVFAQLAQRALAQPQVVMHRDFHSRNLLLKTDGSLGVIDFQDAVVGPLTYDAVSLLRDCYLRLPEAAVRRWALAYGDMAIDAGLMPASTNARQYLQDFDWMGLQRHIKVLGIFARLHLRDGKSQYLHDLPRVLAYVQHIAAAYPELQDFAAWLLERLLPACRAQPWYQLPPECDLDIQGMP